MYNGVNELIEVEKSLDTNTLHFPVWPENCHSLLKKYLTPEIFYQLRNVKDNTGFTL